MKHKYYIFNFVFIFLTQLSFSISLLDLKDIVTNSNAEIASAKKDYEAAQLSAKTLDGLFSPSLSISTSSNFTEKINFSDNLDYFSSIVFYTQNLPFGHSFSIEGCYSYNYTKINQEKYISQLPEINFSFGKNLYPLFIKKIKKDPQILLAKQKSEFYYYQYCYTKKTKLKSLFQLLVYLNIYQNESQIYKNLISLTDEQLIAYKSLKSSGYTNQAKITELENSRWNYQQELINSEMNVVNCLQQLMELSSYKADNKDLENIEILNIDEKILNIFFEQENDPLEELLKKNLFMVDTTAVIEKIDSSPVLSFSFQPKWNYDPIKKTEFKQNKKIDNTPSYVAMVGINFSPVINSLVVKNDSKNKIEKTFIEKNYNDYLAKKNNEIKHYESVYTSYDNQLELITDLYNQEKKELVDYENQYNNGKISKFDYDSLIIRLKNAELNMMCIKLYMLLYKYSAKYY